MSLAHRTHSAHGNVQNPVFWTFLYERFLDEDGGCSELYTRNSFRDTLVKPLFIRKFLSNYIKSQKDDTQVKKEVFAENFSKYLKTAKARGRFTD